jgi:hypothetical protein
MTSNPWEVAAMAEKETPKRRRAWHIKDARGRLVTQTDPVKVHLLNQDILIPADTLRAIADEVLPGARRQRLIQAASVVFAFLFVVGGNVVYFRYDSTSSSLDPATKP